MVSRAETRELEEISQQIAMPVMKEEKPEEQPDMAEEEHPSDNAEQVEGEGPRDDAEEAEEEGPYPEEEADCPDQEEECHYPGEEDEDRPDQEEEECHYPGEEDEDRPDQEEEERHYPGEEADCPDQDEEECHYPDQEADSPGEECDYPGEECDYPGEEECGEEEGPREPYKKSETEIMNEEHNKKFVEIIKSATIDLRKTGADVEADPTLELSLLLDCTCSMSEWIAKAKETIRDIIDNVIKECEEDGSLKCKVSFVGYRDINDSRRFELMPFTDNIDEVKKFIESVSADGGADAPEDVQGGLKLCLMQDWTEEATKRAVLITDAPPHGSKYHDECDDFPEGSPDGLVLEDLMKEICKKEIDFQVIKLNQSVNKMIDVMKENHQDIEVTDMSGVKEEIREARRAEAEEMGGGEEAINEYVHAEINAEEEESYMREKFVKHCVKGMASKVKSKKGGY